MQEALFPEISENIYTISELTRELKALLENKYPTVWVTGEISNFHSHSSGHFYFTLKDSQAQLGAVMFRGANRNLKFKVEDGLEVMANGRVSVYEARGNYQLIVEYLEPKGFGALQLAFDQLRKRLAEEGLFDAERKRPLPFLPKTIALITSPTGAVLRDMVRILHRRHPGINILLHPVSVQGETAGPEIARAIETVNRHGEADLIIVGRGGGSLEDLWAFNTEAVARAIFASKIPVVSAVGHETDVTISDFVADLRAPTPSAAAELAVPLLADLQSTLSEHQRTLSRLIKQSLENKRSALKFFLSHLKHPKRRLEEIGQHLDDLKTRLIMAQQRLLENHRLRLQHFGEQLQALSPLSILSRGYSIIRKLNADGAEGMVLKESTQAKKGEDLSITLKSGHLVATVK